MYLPRASIAQLYTHLQTTTHPSSPPLLLLTALTVDALCATRILTTLLKRDFIPHKIQPVSGYGELHTAGREHVSKLRLDRGGEGGLVVCLGCGGNVEVARELGLTDQVEDADGRVEEVDVEGHGVEVWVLDARRPWDLKTLFACTPLFDADESRRLGVEGGKVTERYRGGSTGKGGIIVWDDGDVEASLQEEREAWWKLESMPDITETDLAFEDGDDDDDENDDDAEDGAEDEGREQGEEQDDDEQAASRRSRKRKAASPSPSDAEDSEDEERPRQRRRSNTSTSIPISTCDAPTSAQPSSQDAAIPSSPPQEPTLKERKRQVLRLRRQYEAVLDRYVTQGSWTAEPVSSMLYSLASELGRDDAELLWLAIVGVESVSLSPFATSAGKTGEEARSRTPLDRTDQVKAVLQDEVRRLHPVPEMDLRRPAGQEVDIPTHARSPTDNSIRLSPEPRFMLIRHWSLYDSMLHSPYLSTRLHVWSEQGRKRLNKLLAKMGISLQEANKGYLHLDMEIKRSLRKRILKFAEQYNLDGLVPAEDAGGYGAKKGWGFVRSWGWRGTMSAVDVATVVSAILEVGPSGEGGGFAMQDLHLGHRDGSRESSYNRRVGLPSPPHSSDSGMEDTATALKEDVPDWTTRRFFAAYDALSPTTHVSNFHPNKPHSHHQSGLAALLAQIPVAQFLARAILRTGSALISKHQIRHLRSFRMGVIREGPDLQTFTHPGALTRLASWISDALMVLDAEKGRTANAKENALVLGALDEGRGAYVVVGLGGGGAGAGRYRTKQEQREREERRKRKEAKKAAKRAARAKRREAEREAKRERLAAIGELDDDDEEDEETEVPESEGSDDASSDGEDEDGDNDEESRKGPGRNRFGAAFQDVVLQTRARVRVESFEHAVIEVKKEDFAAFLEALSTKSVVG